MTDPIWAQKAVTGLGELLAEMERAQSDSTIDWPALMEKARGVGAHLASGSSEYQRIIAGANEKLAGAAKRMQALQEQLEQQPAPGMGAPPRTLRTGLGSGQTVYISAGATAGIAAGALLLGGVGGYAAKAMLDTRKKKKAAAAKEAKELAAARETEETEEEDE